MVADVLRDLWSEPAPPETKSNLWLDRAVIAVLVVAGLIDGLVSDDVTWPTVHVPLMTLLPLALFWRRTHLLPVTAVVFGAYAGLHGAMLLAGVTSTFLNGGLIAVVVYTLARWASGREAAIGLGLAVAGIAIAGSTGLLREVSGAIALPAFIGLVILLGLAVRLWSSRGAARLSEAKMAERNRIARELHDTVAHHVSAIAVQAQGAQEILTSDTDAAADALSVIEEQASKTLAEMRVILGVLRESEPVELVPQPGIGDIARLADVSSSGPAVEVAMSGNLEHISPSVGAGLFRLAQEAVTNARRHARHATHVAVQIVGSDGHVQLTVTDDGRTSSPAGSGYGLLGMTERATLLGGEFHAGPAPTGGWVVTASLPRRGRAS